MVTVAPDGTQDFTTIQAAIDYVTANPFDIEIDVYPGTYQENLLIEADMIIRSVGDANNTIIDGSLGRSLGSTIVIRPETMSTHHPLVEIDGFGITNGKGTDVVNNTITFPDGTHPTEKVGGGMFVYVSSPKINNSQFLDNGNNSTDKGGAVFAASGGDDIGFPDRDHYQDHTDLEPAEGPLDFSNNTFFGNDAHQGHSIYIEGFDGTTTDLSMGYFDVYIENEDLSGSSEYWIKSIGSEFDEASGDGILDAIVGDVYINPDPLIGSDEENDGLSWGSPFQTINFALSQVYADSLNPATIYLAEGTFSLPNNGEQFPIELISWVNLVGQGADLTILDAELTARVININNIEEVSLSNLMIQNGNAEGYYWYEKYGGGIYINNSSPTIEYVNFVDNTSENAGGGIYLYNSTGSYRNLLFTNNSSTHGGGIHIQESPGNSVTIFDSLFVDNNIARVGNGGGIDINYSSSATANQPIVIVQNSIISNNFCEGSGGGIRAGQIGTIFDNIEVKNNVSDDGGGGIFYSGNSGGPRYLKNSIISNNTCGGNNEDVGGGGILIVGTQSLSITNTIITENSATYMDWGSLVGSNGGGIYIKYYTDNLVLENVEITNNIAKDGSAIYKYGDCHGYDLINSTIAGNNCIEDDGYALYTGGDWSPTNIVNSIVNNSNPNVIYASYYENEILLNIGYSTVTEGMDGILIMNPIYPPYIVEDGGIYVEQLYEFNPEFTDTENGDYTLSENSPCINAGTDFYIIDGDTLINLPSNDYFGQAPDLGAYEWYPEEPDYQPGDITEDGQINVLDVVALVNIVLTGGDYNTAGDLNSDGVNNILDVVFLVNIILNG